MCVWGGGGPGKLVTSIASSVYPFQGPDDSVTLWLVPLQSLSNPKVTSCRVFDVGCIDERSVPGAVAYVFLGKPSSNIPTHQWCYTLLVNTIQQQCSCTPQPGQDYIRRTSLLQHNTSGPYLMGMQVILVQLQWDMQRPADTSVQGAPARRMCLATD